MNTIELQQKLLSIKNTNSNNNIKLIKQEKIKENYKKYKKE